MCVLKNLADPTKHFYAAMVKIPTKSPEDFPKFNGDFLVQRHY